MPMMMTIITTVIIKIWEIMFCGSGREIKAKVETEECGNNASEAVGSV